jgi:hypothetical protein
MPADMGMRISLVNIIPAEWLQWVNYCVVTAMQWSQYEAVSTCISKILLASHLHDWIIVVIKGGTLGFTVRRYSSFFLRYFGIFLEKLRNYDIGNLAVHGFAILDSKTAVIDKICLRYYGIEYPPMPPSIYLAVAAKFWGPRVYHANCRVKPSWNKVLK